MKKLYNTSVFYLILGLLSGVFYREFTKFKGINGDTILSVLHSHLLILGFLIFFILVFAEKQYKLTESKKFKSFYISYNTGILLLVGTMILRGIFDINNVDSKALSGIAGLSHIIITIGLILLVLVVKERVVNQSEERTIEIQE